VITAGTEQGQIVLWDTIEQMAAGWPVSAQMYLDMTIEQYIERLEQSRKGDYRQFAYLDKDGHCRGVVGLLFLTRVWCGLQADIDNFVIDRAARSGGIGKALLQHCIDYAYERGAVVATLDTFVDNPASHRFYFREGFTIRGYHFIKPLRGQSIW
jgi:GNAT superfamily N-acetyltransferase